MTGNETPVSTDVFVGVDNARTLAARERSRSDEMEIASVTLSSHDPTLRACSCINFCPLFSSRSCSNRLADLTERPRCPPDRPRGVPPDHVAATMLCPRDEEVRCCVTQIEETR